MRAYERTNERTNGSAAALEPAKTKWMTEWNVLNFERHSRQPSWIHLARPAPSATVSDGIDSIQTTGRRKRTKKWPKFMCTMGYTAGWPRRIFLVPLSSSNLSRQDDRYDLPVYLWYVGTLARRLGRRQSASIERREFSIASLREFLASPPPFNFAKTPMQSMAAHMHGSSLDARGGRSWGRPADRALLLHDVLPRARGLAATGGWGPGGHSRPTRDVPRTIFDVLCGTFHVPRTMARPLTDPPPLVNADAESVNEGHPDKLCDQVSDAILDACLKEDPDAKVACETASKTNMVMVFGEITTTAKVDYEKIVRDTVRNIGFTSDDVGLDADKCKVLVHIEEQSPDIGQGVHGMGTKTLEEMGAGDQGHMFGYATDETPELMPLTHMLATQLGYKLTEVRKNGTCPWLRPDGKTQVTVEYKKEGGAVVPLRCHTILISTQHNEDVSNEKIHADLMEHVIKPVVPAKYLDDKTIFHLNPSGRFVIGGPHGDAGLTGRKIIIDTYGGWGAHGGGAFSGKDPTKVDRSAAYIARQAAKSIVAAKLARRALVQVSYGIGVAEPLSVYVDTYGTGTIPDEEILKLVKAKFDFRAGMIGKALDLRRGGDRYIHTAAYGHFGREDRPDVFTWEKVVPLLD